MPDVSMLAVAVATVAAFLIGFVYYGVVGVPGAAASAREVAAGRAARPARPAWQLPVVELVRCLVLAAVVVGVAAAASVSSAGDGLLLGLVLWVGFPVVLLSGAVYHDGTPVRTALVHSGDWLLKLLAVGLVAALLG